jgi:hypothetical protein
MNRIYQTLGITALLISVSQVAMAAPPPTGVPIDGGISLVLAACAGYGAKKLHDSKKNK